MSVYIVAVGRRRTQKSVGVDGPNHDSVTSVLTDLPSGYVRAELVDDRRAFCRIARFARSRDGSWSCTSDVTGSFGGPVPTSLSVAKGLEEECSRLLVEVARRERLPPFRRGDPEHLDTIPGWRSCVDRAVSLDLLRRRTGGDRTGTIELTSLGREVAYELIDEGYH